MITSAYHNRYYDTYYMENWAMAIHRCTKASLKSVWSEFQYKQAARVNNYRSTAEVVINNDSISGYDRTVAHYLCIDIYGICISNNWKVIS